jgi:histidine triad (HIT) family protein
MNASAYPGAPSELLTVRDVARLCRVHEVTVRRHILQGRLRAVRVGKSVRVRREDFEEYLAPGDGPVELQIEPLRPDDALFRIIGIASSPRAAGLSENKYAAFAEAYSATPGDFCCDDLLTGRVRVDVVVETTNVLAFHHTRPMWPAHIVVTPKRHVESLLALTDADEGLLNEMFGVIKRVAAMVQSEQGGCHIVTNVGAYQESKHLHWHVYGGERLTIG